MSMRNLEEYLQKKLAEICVHLLTQLNACTLSILFFSIKYLVLYGVSSTLYKRNK
jgi:hypothetical protein